MFVDPPLGRVGLTEREVRASGKPALIGTRPMTRVGRAREFGDTRGFMKVLVDAETAEILDAAILGMNGDEAVHSLLDIHVRPKAVYGNLTIGTHSPDHVGVDSNRITESSPVELTYHRRDRRHVKLARITFAVSCRMPSLLAA
ncbi:MAG: hypothetical protein VB948_12560 [Pseudomonadales bacterium]